VCALVISIPSSRGNCPTSESFSEEIRMTTVSDEATRAADSIRDMIAREIRAAIDRNVTRALEATAEELERMAAELREADVTALRDRLEQAIADIRDRARRGAIE
jgi:Asp-tRNA(Asn)/Glu-tRNA(Gln) amidotransferase A subunit family amidase